MLTLWKYFIYKDIDIMKILICDDEAYIRKNILQILAPLVTQYPSLKITECDNGEDVFHCEFDLLILDIEMQGMNGISVKNALEQRNTPYKILFVTSHDELMPSAFGKNVYGFISKPIDCKVLLTQVTRLLDKIENEQDKVFIRNHSQELQMLYLRDIAYIEASKQYTIIHLVDKQSLFCDESISHWENILPQNKFGRCHKSYIIHYAQIDKLGNEILLFNKESIPISRRQKNYIKEQYTKFILRNAN